LNAEACRIELKFLPICKLDKTCATKLAGLDDGVIPIEPARTKYNINIVNSEGKKKRPFERCQLSDLKDKQSCMSLSILRLRQKEVFPFSIYMSPYQEVLGGIQFVFFDDGIFLKKHDTALLEEDELLAKNDKQTCKLELYSPRLDLRLFHSLPSTLHDQSPQDHLNKNRRMVIQASTWSLQNPQRQ
jgi:hypothetical protein